MGEGDEKIIRHNFGKTEPVVNQIPGNNLRQKISWIQQFISENDLFADCSQRLIELVERPGDQTQFVTNALLSATPLKIRHQPDEYLAYIKYIELQEI